MYLTAHRVISQDHRRQAVNSFYYIHGYDWEPDRLNLFLPENNPGTLLDDMILLSPGGNTVRSYLDIVAPDNTAISTILKSFNELLSGQAPDRFPFVCVVSNVWYRFGIEIGIIPAWQQEIRLLFQNAVNLLSQNLTT